MFPELVGELTLEVRACPGDLTTLEYRNDTISPGSPSTARTFAATGLVSPKCLQSRSRCRPLTE
jgi:hypothetical protein